MPRTNFGAAMERARAREAALAALPREVREGVLTLTEAQQDEYLQSIAKAAEMAEAGETWTPDVTKAKAKAKAKGKPGRPAAQAPGARTKERPPLFDRGMNLEAIGEHPEDDPENMVIFGAEAPEGAGKVDIKQAAREREAALEEQRRAELAAAVAKVAETSQGREVLSSPFSAQRRVEADPADPLGVASIETLSYRITGSSTEYVLECRGADGKWSEASRFYDASGLALHFAIRRIVPSPEFAEIVRKLPVSRPARQVYLDSLRTKGARTTPFTAEEQAARTKEVQEEMQRQRELNRLRSGGRPPADYRWF